MHDPSPTLKLYTTEHCSLCEQALDLLLSLQDLGGLRLETVDIALDDALTDRYGESIPVLSVQGRELVWPFTASQVRALLAQR